MIYPSLVVNAALLIALSALYDLLSRSWPAEKLPTKILAGAIFGSLGIAVMTSSWEYSPGIIFDTRSILLGVGGLFLGGVPTVVAMIIASVYRCFLGGTAMWAGIAVIWTSGTIGLAWRHCRKRTDPPSGFRELFAFGLLVHLCMLAWMITLPWPLSLRVLATVSIPVMLIYPLVTVLLGKLMADQNQRRVMEASLAESEAKYREFVQSANNIILRLDTQGRITFVNQFAQSFFGYREEEILGRNAVGTIVPEVDSSGKPMAAVLEAISRNPGECVVHENENIRRNGQRAWIAWTNRALLDERGKTTGVLCVGTDISTQRRAEETLRELAEILERRVQDRTAELKERNDELESFAYTVSHDLRAPLRAMEGFSTALCEDYTDRLDEQGRTYLGYIVEASKKMDSLITDLLEYSRIGRSEFHLHPVHLGKVVEEAVRQLSSEIDARQATISVDGEFPPVTGHPPTLRQVVVNLVSNALKFVDSSKRPAIRIWSERRGTAVRLWVEDNGIGIGEEHQEQIFGVFARLHAADAYPGTGIGLAIVRRATNRMGGRFGVESSPGAGSRFWVEYPSAQEVEAEEPM